MKPSGRLAAPATLALASLLALAPVSGCLVDDEDAVFRGDVAVVVVDQRGQPVPDARVYTIPTSIIETVTDAFGTASVRGAEALTYDLYAEHEGAIARTVLRVGPGQLAATRLQLPTALPGGGNPDGSPLLFITSPEFTRSYFADEAIEFDATARDDATPGTELELTWVSSIDGELGSGNGDLNGRLVFEEELSVGWHRLTLTAVDGDGDETELKWSVFVRE